MPLGPYGLPTPPTQRRVPASRMSAVQRLMARVAAARAARPRRRQRPRPNIRIPPPAPPPQRRQPGAKPTVKTLTKQEAGDPRRMLAMIAEYARARKVVVLRYRKVTENGKQVTRGVEPYSLRYRITKKRGRARYFYAYCVWGPTVGIHSFLLDNIDAVIGTDKVYTPKWRVEF